MIAFSIITEMVGAGGRQRTTFSLVGESGCGKPTLARVIAGLDLRCSGSLVFGRPADGRVQRTETIFQDPYASLIPRWRVGDAIAESITF